jgi:hypothetical protein
MKTPDSDQVTCRSGHEFAERPTAFIWEGEHLQIDRIVARWRMLYGKRFLVRTLDDRIFTLAFFEPSASWQIEQGDQSLIKDPDNYLGSPVSE